MIDVAQTTEFEIFEIEFAEPEFSEIAEIWFIDAVFRFVVIVVLFAILIDF